jgi:tRNA A-37 threonylcarbamoyl transferase component Bud32/tetratricopeptide (TPR) repeat protein
MPLSAGSKLGPYVIVAPLGAGGMGEVYRARDTRLRREVAIKVLPESLALNAAERFQVEARAASSLTHPHICAVYDVGEADGRLFLVMQLVDGTTLREHANATPLEAADVVAIGSQIADALEAAHARGIFHRDIKPGNIMIDSRRQVKLLDFGLARHAAADQTDQTRADDFLTATGTIVGTPQYMSPEVLQGKAADARSDLWALGVVLYELLAGQLPFQGGSAVDVSARILRDRVPALPARVPSKLRMIVDRCLAKRPEERYQHAGEVRVALGELQTAPAAVRSRAWWAPWAVAVLAITAGATAYELGRPGRDTGARRTSTDAPTSASREANEAFELSMQFMRVQNDIPRGNQMLERALALDPHFAEARRYHAFNYALSILNGYANDTSMLYKAEEELRQAAQDDPSLPSLPSALTAVYLMQGRRELVPAEAMDRVSQQYPSNRDTILWRAILAYFGEDNKTTKELTRGILDREPLNGAARMFLGEALRTEGDVSSAIREQQKVLDQAPQNISAIRDLAVAYLDGGALSEARRLLESKRAAFAANYMWRSTWALLLAREDKSNEALDAMDEQTLKFLAVAFPATLDAADFYALVGDTGKALEWLDRAVRNGDERVAWFRRNARLASVQRDPRFQTIIDSVEARRKQRQRSPS